MCQHILKLCSVQNFSNGRISIVHRYHLSGIHMILFVGTELCFTHKSRSRSRQMLNSRVELPYRVYYAL
jgi:hypothetical protein